MAILSYAEVLGVAEVLEVLWLKCLVAPLSYIKDNITADISCNGWDKALKKFVVVPSEGELSVVPRTCENAG